MTITMKMALAMAMATGLMANAQQTAVQQTVNLPGVKVQADASLVPVQQVKDDLFAGTEKFAAGASDVTEINFGPKTMGMVGKTNGKNGELARKMRTMVIHTYKYDKPGMYRMEDVDVYRKKLEDGTWSCSVHVRNKTGSTDICSRTSSDQGTSEMVIITAEPLELTFIHMIGRVSLKDLQNMGDTKGNVKIP